MNSRSKIRQTERGSALLIVFVFAAIVAIMLYEEMPNYAFEARRQKEQLLIDRGNEYVHAVKLYYRKVGGFPASLDRLENTNRMRFLRHRYKDPFTDKDDWRLLHMGPGFQLLDSKVNRLQTNQAGGSRLSGNSSSATFPSSSNNTSGITGLSASNSNSDSAPTVKVPPVRHRGPAISVDGVSGVSDDSDGLATTEPALPAELPAPPSAPGEQGQGNSSTPGSNAMHLVQNLFNNQSSPQSANSSRLGTMQGGGGIAGVASRASGHSIKTVGDQDDYSLWEFYYDPSKDLRQGVAGGSAPVNATTGPPNGSTSSTTTGQSSTNSSSGFHLDNLGLGSSGSVPNGTR